MNPLSHHHSIKIELPIWLGEFEEGLLDRYETEGDRMSVAISLAERNVALKSGGPFGAAVFDVESGEVISLGVNVVVESGYSIAHAEMVALSFAQDVLGVHDLSQSARPNLQLVTSVEPCAMCLGAIPWSGVRGVAYGARTADAEAVGFDEGPKMANWELELEKRGIRVVGDVKRDAAIAPLRNYRDGGGAIYNGRGDS